MFCELTRIINHILNVASTALDMGGITPLFWLFDEMNKVISLLKDIRILRACIRCAYARCLYKTRRRFSSIKILTKDIPLGILNDIHVFIERYIQRLDELEDVTIH